MQSFVMHDDVVDEPTTFAIHFFSELPTISSTMATTTNMAVKRVRQRMSSNILHQKRVSVQEIWNIEGHYAH